jgi:UDP-glucose 4-epimerase
MAETTWLVTGAAGYIGSHVAKAFEEHGFNVLCLDNLSSGLQSRISEQVEFLDLDIRDTYKLNKLFNSREINGVVHLAALKSVEESISNPLKYFEINSFGTKNLLDISVAAETEHFIFSSTAAVYGNGDPDNAKVSESFLPVPISPYGFSKLKAERNLSEYLEDGKLTGVSLRYFNVAGAINSKLRDHSISNLIPKVVSEISQQITPTIFGDNYQTPDGTCIRDFIHVEDIARAHLLTATKLRDGKGLPLVMNIGSSEGYSVRAIVDKIQEILGTNLEIEISPPREGDPPQLVADASLAKTVLGFDCLYGIEEMIRSSILDRN